MKYFITCLLIGVSLCSYAQDKIIQNGPMVGHVSSREAKIWLQTTRACTVQIAYWKAGYGDEVYHTATTIPQKVDAFTTILVLDKIVPNHTYQYEVIINDITLSLDRVCQFSSPPMATEGDLPEFSFAFGSCNYINDPTTDTDTKGGEYHIFQTITDQQPTMMLWLGDNIYLRPEDWDSHSGFAYRYTHSRNIPEMRALLSSTINYAIWDDHDYGPNDSDRSYIHKDMALHWFKKFWVNPSYGLPGYGVSGNSGITTAFTWGDVDFFLLDNRYFRSPQKRATGKKTVLGEAQLEWLIDALAFSEANVKIVVLGSLFLSNMSHYKNQNYISNYAEERAYILAQLEAENVKNVLFLTGDKHFSEVSRLVNAQQNVIYEFTASPLTASPNTREDQNTLRLEGSLIQKRNFGWVEFTGKSFEERAVTVKILDSEGNVQYSHTFGLQ